MKLHTNQMSDSFRVGAMLAVVGGFLDVYTYLLRGGVFANAQTGNIVLMSASLAKTKWLEGVGYFVPIVAFSFGILLDEVIRHKWNGKFQLHWRQMVLLLEMAILTIVILLPYGTYDFLANALVSLICSLQVQSFRKVHGLAYASTMCTGNLRSGTDNLVQYLHTKNNTYLQKTIRYYGIILFFIIGAAVGAIGIHLFGGISVLLCLILLLITFLLLFVNEQHIQIQS